ncbi:MAG TPA: hypothetical protein VF003_00745 [Pseudonocardiaceae bacterium]
MHRSARVVPSGAAPAQALTSQLDDHDTMQVCTMLHLSAALAVAAQAACHYHPPQGGPRR